MNNLPIELGDQLVEERLLQVLAWNNVLPYVELKTRAIASVDDCTFRRVINGLIARGLVQRQVARRGLWYLGYAKAPADHVASLDDVPAPFRKLLSELAW
jgi:hypothetical protein